jgi:hypothetical protein
MQQAVQRIFSLFIKTNPPRKRKLRKSRGQSLVEVAIAFPILIILFSGMIEFGFMINAYLALLDATRDAARLYSNGDPFCTKASDPPLTSCPVANATVDDPNFYLQTAIEVRRNLDPSYRPETNTFDPAYKGRRLALDPLNDDVIVTVYGVKGNTVIWNRPSAGPYHLFTNGKYTSIFNSSSILNNRITDAPNAGILLVEAHYIYHQVLKLPWMKPFDPIRLRVYTIMPIRAAEPP